MDLFLSPARLAFFTALSSHCPLVCDRVLDAAPNMVTPPRPRYHGCECHDFRPTSFCTAVSYYWIMYGIYLPTLLAHFYKLVFCSSPSSFVCPTPFHPYVSVATSTVVSSKPQGLQRHVRNPARWFGRWRNCRQRASFLTCRCKPWGVDDTAVEVATDTYG